MLHPARLKEQKAQREVGPNLPPRGRQRGGKPLQHQYVILMWMKKKMMTGGEPPVRAGIIPEPVERDLITPHLRQGRLIRPLVTIGGKNGIGAPGTLIGTLGVIGNGRIRIPSASGGNWKHLSGSSLFLLLHSETFADQVSNSRQLEVISRSWIDLIGFVERSS